MRAKQIGLFWAKLIAFLCVLAMLVNAAGALLGEEHNIDNALSLDHLPYHSVDVLWLGTSHIHHNVIPQYLYDNYGVASTIGSGNSQELSATYWTFREALLRQSPQVVVVDVYAATAPYSYFYVQNVLATRDLSIMTPGSNPHNTASAVARWLPIGSPFKIPAIWSAYATSQADGDAYFRLTRMHSRYNELGRDSFMNLWGEGLYVNTFGYTYYGNSIADESIPERPYSLEAAKAVNELGTRWSFTDEQLAEVELAEDSVYWLRRIIQLAKSRHIELILCAAPYLTNAAEEKLFSQVGELAAAEGVPFLNTDASGVSELAYFHDIGHMNYDGARLYTDFFARYFAQHYALPDRRESTDARYAPWRERVGAWAAQDAAMSLVDMPPALTPYLEILTQLDDDYYIILSSMGDVYDGFTEEDFALMTDGLGIPQDVLQDWYDYGNGTLDAILCGDTVLYANYEPDGREQSLRLNFDGHDIVLAAPEERSTMHGQSLGQNDYALNIAVFSLPENRLMDHHAFDLTVPYEE